MRYHRLDIEDVIVCEPKVNVDNRGFVYEAFNKKSFESFVGNEIDFCQDNLLSSKYGVIRGLHTNTLHYAQSKLVSVLQGHILDVAVDFRIGSPSFGKYIAVELSSTNKRQLFVPKGFLHGFSVLSDNAIVNIKIDSYFAAGESIGVKYDDETLRIDWQIPDDKVVLSKSDTILPSFDSILSPFRF